jgi:hypothetical protein
MEYKKRGIFVAKVTAQLPAYQDFVGINNLAETQILRMYLSNTEPLTSSRPDLR